MVKKVTFVGFRGATAQSPPPLVYGWTLFRNCAVAETAYGHRLLWMAERSYLF